MRLRVLPQFNKFSDLWTSVQVLFFFFVFCFPAVILEFSSGEHSATVSLLLDDAFLVGRKAL